MKKVLKAIGKTMKLIFIVFCVFLLSLCFRQQRLPRSVVAKICDRCSTDKLVVSCDEISVGLRHGFHFLGVRLYDRTRSDNLKPVFSADSVSVWLITRRVRVTAAKLPRLHDGYYGIDTPAAPEFPDGEKAEENGGLAFAKIELPRIPDFTLELIRPEILGVAPERVEARVRPELKKVDFADIHLDWPDQDFRMWLDGYCTVDFGAQLLIGEVAGSARQEHIRPLLVALDLPVSYPYMGGYSDTGDSGFTEVQGPVPAVCRWKYDFAARDFNLDLDLKPDMGRYNGVRLQKVDGKLGVHAYYPDGDFAYDITVGPLVATDLHERRLQGWLTVHGTNNLDWLEFDAYSDLEKQDTLDIMGYLNKGTFDALKCETPPKVTVKGVFNCDDVNIGNNDFGGHFELAKGEILDQKLSDLKFDYHLKGSEIVLTNCTAVGSTGGDMTAWMRFHLPMADDDESGFYGEGDIDTTNGRILQVPLFLALTKAMAANVPGVDKIVNQSESHCEFTISNGVFKTDHLVVQGALFCFKLSGSYEIESGELDFIAHCTVMKEESLLGKYLIQPVLWPFTKLFTEFHVTGNKNDPKLRNTSVKSISEFTGDLIKKVFD